MTTTEVADYHKFSTRTVRKWIATKRIKAIKRGRDWHIEPEEVQAFRPPLQPGKTGRPAPRSEA